MQHISNEKTVKKTTQDLKNLISLSLSTQARKAKQIVAMMLSIEKTFFLMGDDIVKFSNENETLKVKQAVSIKNKL